MSSQQPTDQELPPPVLSNELSAPCEFSTPQQSQSSFLSPQHLHLTSQQQPTKTSDSPTAISGNVEVAIRCRPRLPFECDQVVDYSYGNSQQLSHSQHHSCFDSIGYKNVKMQNKFQWNTFDHAFPPATEQMTLYNASVLPLIKKFLMGYNCTIFSYGQTGSGKSHTTFGLHNNLTMDNLRTKLNNTINNSSNATKTTNYSELFNKITESDDMLRLISPDMQYYQSCGLFQRSCCDIFSFINGVNLANNSHHSIIPTDNMINTPIAGEEGFNPSPQSNQQPQPIKTVSLSFSLVEIYKDDVFDLLSGNKNSNGANKINIRENSDGTIDLQNCVIKPIDSMYHLLDAFSTGIIHRVTTETKMNATSSRSHCILNLYLKQTTTYPANPMNPLEKPRYAVTKSLCSICDLCGSERVSKTGCVGDNLKEGISINSSLSALSRVINAIVKKQQLQETGKIAESSAVHIPYRESSITKVLKESLLGNSLTLLIACISPAETNYEESLSTLLFATNVRGIKKTNIVVNKDPESMMLDEMKRKIRMLQHENRILKEKMGISVDNDEFMSDYNPHQQDDQTETLQKQLHGYYESTQQAVILLQQQEQQYQLMNNATKQLHHEIIDLIKAHQNPNYLGRIDEISENIHTITNPTLPLNRDDVLTHITSMLRSSIELSPITNSTSPKPQEQWVNNHQTLDFSHIYNLLTQNNNNNQSDQNTPQIMLSPQDITEIPYEYAFGLNKHHKKPFNTLSQKNDAINPSRSLTKFFVNIPSSSADTVITSDPKSHIKSDNLQRKRSSVFDRVSKKSTVSPQQASLLSSAQYTAFSKPEKTTFSRFGTTKALTSPRIHTLNLEKIKRLAQQFYDEKTKLAAFHDKIMNIENMLHAQVIDGDINNTTTTSLGDSEPVSQNAPQAEILTLTSSLTTTLNDWNDYMLSFESLHSDALKLFSCAQEVRQQRTKLTNNENNSATATDAAGNDQNISLRKQLQAKEREFIELKHQLEKQQHIIQQQRARLSQPLQSNSSTSLSLIDINGTTSRIQATIIDLKQKLHHMQLTQSNKEKIHTQNKKIILNDLAKIKNDYLALNKDHKKVISMNTKLSLANSKHVLAINRMTKTYTTLQTKYKELQKSFDKFRTSSSGTIQNLQQQLSHNTHSTALANAKMMNKIKQKEAHTQTLSKAYHLDSVPQYMLPTQSAQSTVFTGNESINNNSNANPLNLTITLANNSNGTLNDNSNANPQTSRGTFTAKNNANTAFSFGNKDFTSQSTSNTLSVSSSQRNVRSSTMDSALPDVFNRLSSTTTRGTNSRAVTTTPRPQASRTTLQQTAAPRTKATNVTPSLAIRSYDRGSNVILIPPSTPSLRTRSPNDSSLQLSSGIRSPLQHTNTSNHNESTNNASHQQIQTVIENGEDENEEEEEEVAQTMYKRRRSTKRPSIRHTTGSADEFPELHPPDNRGDGQNENDENQFVLLFDSTPTNTTTPPHPQNTTQLTIEPIPVQTSYALSSSIDCLMSSVFALALELELDTEAIYTPAHNANNNSISSMNSNNNNSDGITPQHNFPFTSLSSPRKRKSMERTSQSRYNVMSSTPRVQNTPMSPGLSVRKLPNHTSNNSSNHTNTNENSY